LPPSADASFADVHMPFGNLDSFEAERNQVNFGNAAGVNQPHLEMYNQEAHMEQPEIPPQMPFAYMPSHFGGAMPSMLAHQTGLAPPFGFDPSDPNEHVMPHYYDNSFQYHSSPDSKFGIRGNPAYGRDNKFPQDPNAQQQQPQQPANPQQPQQPQQPNQAAGTQAAAAAHYMPMNQMNQYYSGYPYPYYPQPYFNRMMYKPTYSFPSTGYPSPPANYEDYNKYVPASQLPQLLLGGQDSMKVPPAQQTAQMGSSPPGGKTFPSPPPTGAGAANPNGDFNKNQGGDFKYGHQPPAGNAASFYSPQQGFPAQQQGQNFFHSQQPQQPQPYPQHQHPPRQNQQF
jgi:hypothetical protein